MRSGQDARVVAPRRLLPLWEAADVAPRLVLQVLCRVLRHVVHHQVALLEVPRPLQKQHRAVVHTFAKRKVVTKPTPKVHRGKRGSVKHKPCVAVDPREDDRDKHEVYRVVRDLPELWVSGEDTASGENLHSSYGRTRPCGLPPLILFFFFFFSFFFYFGMLSLGHHRRGRSLVGSLERAANVAQGPLPDALMRARRHPEPYRQLVEVNRELFAE